MDKNLAYSEFVEGRPRNAEPLRYTLPKRVQQWVGDDTVSSCYNCNATFSLLFRRHHCRFCGKVFCSSCVKYSAMIPNDLFS